MNTSFQCDNRNRKIPNNISINLENGKHVGLTALSGFGKTISCRMLTGYEKLDHGTVMLGERNISSCASYNLVQMMWQHPELLANPHLKMQKVLREGDFVEERVVCGLGIKPNWLSQCPSELPGRELRRSCIARALGKCTRFILTGEINIMLDLITQSRIWGFLLEEMKTRNLGLLVINYLEELLECICDRVVDLGMD